MARGRGRGADVGGVNSGRIKRFKTEVERDEWQRGKKRTGRHETEDREGNRTEKVGKDGKEGQEDSINQTLLTA